MMRIELDHDQRQRLWQFVHPHTAAHLDAGVEPPTVVLQIELGGPYGDEASAVIGPARLGLGLVSVQLV